MIVHTLVCGEHPDTTQANIVENGDYCIIEIQGHNASSEIELNLNQLHDFIGTLLHVQKKIRNK